MTDTSHDTAHEHDGRHDPIYDTLAARPEFVELRRAYRGFVFPATLAFLSLVPALRRALQLGARLHGPPAVRQHQRRAGLRDPAVRHDLRPGLRSTAATPPSASTRWPRQLRRASTRSGRRRPLMDHQVLTTVLFLGRRRHHRRHHLLGQPHHVRHGRLLRRRPRLLGPAERPGHRRRLHVGRLVPRHLRRHRPVRLRRLPLLRRLPRRLARRPAAGRRDAAQLRAATRWPTSWPTGCASARSAPRRRRPR